MDNFLKGISKVEILDSLPSAIAIIDTELNLKWVNRSFTNIIGVTNSDLTGEQKCYSVLNNIMKCQNCPFKNIVKITDTSEFNVVTAKTDEEKVKKTFHIKFTPLKNSDNKIIGAIEEFEDISNSIKDNEIKKRYLNELEQSIDLYHKTFTTSPDSVNINRLSDGIYKKVNPGFLNIMGYKEEDVIGRTSVELGIWHNPDDRVRLVKLLKKDKMVSHFEAKFVKKSGEIVDGLMSASIVDIDNVPHIISVTKDITKIKKLGEELAQSQKMDSIGRLAGGVAHDFNNMLSVIMGNVELAKEYGIENSELTEYLGEIQKAAEHSADLTSRLLAFARKQTISPVVVCLNDEIEKILKMLRRLIGENIELQWLPGNGLNNIKIDPAQIDQILANLIINSKDSISGNGAIIVETENFNFDSDYCKRHPEVTAGAYIMLAISDDGSGIDAANLSKIYDPFFTTKSLKKGTGLGLSTVFGIVKQNSGFINVYSEVGKGTTFKIYFPVLDQEITTIRKSNSSEILYGNGETILIVEDELSILKITEKMLKILNYNVISSSAPDTAIEKLRKSGITPDLVISDVVMPRMNGKMLTDLLKKEYPNLKVIFMSGYTQNVIVHEGIMEEGINFIQKPFSIHSLAQKVHNVLTS